MYEISREPLNGFAPNSRGRLVWSLARTRLNVKVKGQGRQGQKRYFSARSEACVRFVFGKTSLASSLVLGWFTPRMRCSALRRFRRIMPQYTAVYRKLSLTLTHVYRTQDNVPRRNATHPVGTNRWLFLDTRRKYLSRLLFRQLFVS